MTRTRTETYRVIAVRHEKWSRRWHWTLEEFWRTRDQPDFIREGFAWTLEGALQKAQAAIHGPYDTRRMEVLLVYEIAYTPRDRRPSPLNARLVGPLNQPERSTGEHGEAGSS